MKCGQSSQFAEVGPHSSRRVQRQSRSRTHRFKSWCVRLPKRSVSRESNNPSLRRSHRSEYFTQNTCCESSKEKNMHDYEPNYGRASPTTVQYMKFLQPLGRGPTVLEVNVLPQLQATVTVPRAYRLRNTDPQINKR